MERTLYLGLWRELAAHKSMIFLAGPRQAGKTTLARRISGDFTNHLYFNYDLETDKKQLLGNPLFFKDMSRSDTSTPLVVFDEIHKRRGWKTYLKGIYDGYASEFRFLVLGSGRLDQFQRGGDSMAGRYFQFYLWPLTLVEIAGDPFPLGEFLKDPLLLREKEKKEGREAWLLMERVSGFPEPFLAGGQENYRRWEKTYRRQVIREDIRDLTALRDIDTVDSLYTLLHGRIGSPLSLESLGRDLQVPSKTVKQWIEVLERFFLIFRIPPWTKKIHRALTKEKKVYLMNPALAETQGACYENMVALELFRAVSNWNDWGWGNYSLHYLRTKEKQEVDFLISDGNKPLFMVECKLASDQVPSGLMKLQHQLGIPALVLVQREGVYKRDTNRGLPVLTVSAPWWLQGLP